MAEKNNQKPLETILLFIVIFIALYWFSHNRIWIALAFGLAMISLIFPSLANLLSRSWLILSNYTGKIMNVVLMTLVFIFVVIPLGWLSRKLGKNTIIRKVNPSTYYQQSNKNISRADLENPW